MRSDQVNGAVATSAQKSQTGVQLTLCAADDRSADCSISEEEFVALTVRYERRVRLFITTLHPERSDVDEIVQDSWLIAWKKINAFRYNGDEPDEEFVRWVCTISRYEVM